MLLAALASVLIASCYDGDTCTTSAGEKVRLACIDTPELRGKRANPVPAKAARDYLRVLVVGREVSISRINKDRYCQTVGELFVDQTNVEKVFICPLLNIYKLSEYHAIPSLFHNKSWSKIFCSFELVEYRCVFKEEL